MRRFANGRGLRASRLKTQREEERDLWIAVLRTVPPVHECKEADKTAAEQHPLHSAEDMIALAPSEGYPEALRERLLTQQDEGLSTIVRRVKLEQPTGVQDFIRLRGFSRDPNPFPRTV
jgi:hypothetical protein